MKKYLLSITTLFFSFQTFSQLLSWTPDFMTESPALLKPGGYHLYKRTNEVLSATIINFTCKKVNNVNFLTANGQCIKHG